MFFVESIDPFSYKRKHPKKHLSVFISHSVLLWLRSRHWVTQDWLSVQFGCNAATTKTNVGSESAERNNSWVPWVRTSTRNHLALLLDPSLSRGGKNQFALAPLRAKQRQVCLSLGVGLEVRDGCSFVFNGRALSGRARGALWMITRTLHGGAAPLAAPRPPLPLPLPPPGRLLLRRGRAGPGPGGSGGAMSQHSTLLHLLAGGWVPREAGFGGRRAPGGGIRAAGPAAAAGQPGQDNPRRGRAAPAGQSGFRRAGPRGRGCAGPDRGSAARSSPAAPQGMPGSAAWEDGEPPCGTRVWSSRRFPGMRGEGSGVLNESATRHPCVREGAQLSPSAHGWDSFSGFK